MKYRDLERLMRQDGWEWDRSRRGKGSHRVFRHPNKPNIIVLPFHGRNTDVAPGLLGEILREAGLLK